MSDWPTRKSVSIPSGHRTCNPLRSGFYHRKPSRLDCKQEKGRYLSSLTHAEKQSRFQNFAADIDDPLSRQRAEKWRQREREELKKHAKRLALNKGRKNAKLDGSLDGDLDLDFGAMGSEKPLVKGEGESLLSTDNAKELDCGLAKEITEQVTNRFAQKRGIPETGVEVTDTKAGGESEPEQKEMETSIETLKETECSLVKEVSGGITRKSKIEVSPKERKRRRAREWTIMGGDGGGIVGV